LIRPAEDGEKSNVSVHEGNGSLEVIAHGSNATLKIGVRNGEKLIRTDHIEYADERHASFMSPEMSPGLGMHDSDSELDTADTTACEKTTDDIQQRGVHIWANLDSFADEEMESGEVRESDNDMDEV